MKVFKYIVYILAACGVIGIVSSIVEFNQSKNDEASEPVIDEYVNEVQIEDTDDDLISDVTIVEKGTSISDWTARVSFPEQSDIIAWNASSTQRSPYMAVWFHVPAGVRLPNIPLILSRIIFLVEAIIVWVTGIWIIHLLNSSIRRLVQNMARMAMLVFKISTMETD